MVMSQTHIFNFFPGSIHGSRILKTLSLFASRQKNSYIPNQQVWINRLYFQISNSKEKKCLTIDTTEVSELGPGKFRTSADNYFIILTEIKAIPTLLPTRPNESVEIIWVFLLLS